MSEFGQGLCYCLGLFLCHSEREDPPQGLPKAAKSASPRVWFNGASDHLYDLIIPEDMNWELAKRLNDFKGKVINWGHGLNGDEPTIEDQTWAIQEAKNLLLLIDRDIGIDAVKGEYE